ncbi:hypothetical protein LUZ60_006606 [Juncus effusus]|nr:hypothetical protein LUZ60_006606 [Juncus effusus]
MEVEILNSILLKPSGLDLSSKTRIPLTIFDRAHYNGRLPLLHAFNSPMPSNKDLTIGLTKALDLCPVLGGHVFAGDSHRPYIQLNTGARLIEAKSRSPLSVFLDESPMDTVVEQPPELSLLYPPISSMEDFQIQITRFSCGGVVLGMTCHHLLSDAHSMSDFFSMWADIVRKPHSKEKLHGNFDISRADLVVPRDPPISKFSHQEIEFNLITNASVALGSVSSDPIPDLKNVRVEFSPDFIADLKALVGGRCTTFGCIVAHLWRKITRARTVKGNEITHVRIAMDGRMKSRLNMPDFFGNMVLWAFPRLSAEELLVGAFADTINVIRKAIGSVNQEYFKSFIDFGKIMEGREEELASTLMLEGNRLSPNLELNSLLSFKYHELEFVNGNKPCAFIAPDLSVDGLIMLVPSCKENGGVVAYISMLKDNVDEFKRTCFILE